MQDQLETALVTSWLGIRGNDREQSYGPEEAEGDTVMVETGLRAVGDGCETREEWSSTLVASPKSKVQAGVVQHLAHTMLEQ